MTHHDLALESPYSFKGNTDNDEDRRTADADTSERGNAQRQNDREYCHDTEEYSADQGDLVERVVDEIRSGLARTITGDSAVVLLQVVCDLNRIVLDRYIEVVECDDEQEVDHCVQRSALVEHSEESTPEALVLFRDVEEVEDRLRKAHQRHCEDDRHNTGHSDLDRNVGGLTAVHLSADNALGILHRNSSLGVGHHDDEPHHSDEDDDSEEHEADVCGLISYDGHEVVNSLGQARDDTCEQYHGDTVADTLFIDTVAEPDDHRRAGNEAGNDNDGSKHDGEHIRCGIVHIAVLEYRDVLVVLAGGAVSESEVESERLENGYSERCYLSDGVQLLSALLALFLELLQRRDSDSQQLNDDRRVDVRRDRHRQQSSLSERTTRHNVEVVQQGSAVSHSLNGVVVEEGNEDVRA